jgi:hypothetical protein
MIVHAAAHAIVTAILALCFYLTFKIIGYASAKFTESIVEKPPASIKSRSETSRPLAKSNMAANPVLIHPFEVPHTLLAKSDMAANRAHVGPFKVPHTLLAESNSSSEASRAIVARDSKTLQVGIRQGPVEHGIPERSCVARRAIHYQGMFRKSSDHHSLDC